MSRPAGSTNRLARQSSPYLLLHAGNPVDWFPWGTEAIEKARREDKPIFLSVGYSTCYWCHVMERESFSDPAIAAEMNRHFVNIKVDREERPDLDEIYMLATQILSSQGGWPNSVFLTPGLEPFFAGTYFPPEDAHGRPGFPTVLRSMVLAWAERRDEVLQQARELSESIRGHLEEVEPWSGPLPGAELAERGLDGLRQRFDATWGGFGQQPKFPTPSNLWLLDERSSTAPEAAMMLAATLGSMARGGIFDQVGGGFHRYATDREWRVPHFEKMLYDNGLLLEAYAREHRRTGSPEAARVARETAAWIGREMSAPEGAFWSAIDAETDGHEGAFYVWTRSQLEAALGPEDAEYLAPILGFSEEPFFEQDAYVLHLPRPIEVQAQERRVSASELLTEIDPLRARLLARRSQRRRPATDDKILADWNGTAIAGLAVAGRLLGAPELLASARRAARFVLEQMRSEDGTLLHSWRRGSGSVPAFLSDYAFLIRGLLRLHEADEGREWLDRAVELEAEQRRRLGSTRGGYFNAEESAELLSRSKELFDGAVPAANGVAALNLLDLERATGESGYRTEAERTLRAFASIVATHPDGARTLAIACSRFASGESRPGSGSFEGSRSPERPFEAAAAIGDLELELEDQADETGYQGFIVRFVVRDGWHLPSEGELPMLRAPGAELDDLRWPPASELASPADGGALLGHAGEVVVRGRIRFDTPRPYLVLRFVACGEGRCLPPAELEIRFR